MDTVPLKDVVGTVVDAVMTPVPLPYTYPVRVDAPVPPLAAFKVPLKTMLPAVGVEGERPVVPALNVTTPPDSENVLQVPPEYPSNTVLSVLNRIIPFCPVPC